MTRSTYDVVSRFYDHAARNEIDAMLPLLADDFLMHEAPSIPVYGGDHHGPQGFAEVGKRLGEVWATFEVRDMRVLDAGDYAIALFHPRLVARGSGAEGETWLAEFCRVRDGKIYELRAFYFDGPAIARALGEPVGRSASGREGA